MSDEPFSDDRARRLLREVARSEEDIERRVEGLRSLLDQVAALFTEYGFEISSPSEAIGTMNWTYDANGLRLQLRPSTKGKAVRGVLQRFDEGHAVSRPASVKVAKLVWDPALGRWFASDPADGSALDAVVASVLDHIRPR